MAPRLGPLMALFIRQCVLWMAMTVLWSASVSFDFFSLFSFSCCSVSVTGVVLCGDRPTATAASQSIGDGLLIGARSVAGMFILMSYGTRLHWCAPDLTLNNLFVLCVHPSCLKCLTSWLKVTVSVKLNVYEVTRQVQALNCVRLSSPWLHQKRFFPET